MTNSPPVTKYKQKTFTDLSKNNGKSFGQARDKLPDNSYLVPQMHKMPGPGQVLLFIFSTKIKKIKAMTTDSLLEINLMTSLKPTSLTKNLQDQEHTQISISTLKMEDLQSLNTQMLLILL